MAKETLLEKKAEELSAKDSDLKYLIQEYHDGLLLYEISNRLVWDKAAKMNKDWLPILPRIRRNISGNSLALRESPIM